MQRRHLIKALLAVATGSVCGILAPTLLAQRGRRTGHRSVAGSRRGGRRGGPSRSNRRRRRMRRRIALNMYMNSLPYGCGVTRIRGGVTYYYCGNIWYQPRYRGTTIVYVVIEIESGANTSVEFDEYY